MPLPSHAPLRCHDMLHRVRVACALLTLCVACSACSRTEQTPAEKVTIAYATLSDTALAQVAQVQGFFRAEGLDVSPHLHAYGKLALQELLAGQADFATVAETPVMLVIL